MKTLSLKSWTRAFTRLDLIIVIATIGLFLVFLSAFPTHSRGGPSHRIMCVSNLKQIGLAFRIFDNDHDGHYPFAVPNLTNVHTGILLTSNVTTAKVWMHFQVLSNELKSPKVLTCRADKTRMRTRAEDFSTSKTGLPHRNKRDSAVSYFVGLRADRTETDAILAGDRNLSPLQSGPAYSSHASGGAIHVSQSSTWTDAKPTRLHDFQGNVALADGSVLMMTTQKLQQQLALATNNYGTNINLFLFPQ